MPKDKDIDLRLFVQLFQDDDAPSIVLAPRGLPVQGREGNAYTLEVEFSSKQEDGYRLVRIGENHHAGGDFMVGKDGVTAIIPSIEEMCALHLAEDVKDVLLEFEEDCRLDFPCSLDEVKDWALVIIDVEPDDIDRRYRELTGEPPGRGRPERRESLKRIIEAMQEIDPDLSIKDMPGTKGDLLDFCEKIDHRQFTIKESSFSDVIKGWIAFTGGRHKGTSDYYSADRLNEVRSRLG